MQSPETCPICGTAAPFLILCPAVLAMSEPVYSLVECDGCHARFLDPLPDTEALSRFYAPHYYGSDWYKQEEKGRMFARSMLRRGFGGRFLDVGCNLGYFLRAVADASGCEAHGVEISPEAVSYARNELSLDVRCGELMDAGYPDRFFDFIRVNNVLEHVRDPLGFIRECSRILRKGGKLYLSVPNGPVDGAGLINYFHEEKSRPAARTVICFFFPETRSTVFFKPPDWKSQTRTPTVYAAVCACWDAIQTSLTGKIRTGFRRIFPQGRKSFCRLARRGFQAMLPGATGNSVSKGFRVWQASGWIMRFC